MTSHDLRRAIQASAIELSLLWGGGGSGGDSGGRSDEWWATRGLDAGDWHGLAANMLVEVFDSDVVMALESSAARLPLEGGEGARAWEARCGRGAEPPDVVAERDDWHRDEHGLWCEWGGSMAPRVPPPTLDASAFNPRAHPHPPVPHPATTAIVLHNRESDNPVPLDSELCAEILRSLEDAPDCDDNREDVERYRGGGSEDASEATSDGSPDDDDARSHDTRDTEHERPHSALCRVSPVSERAACRWTLTGRGVRLRADLASPEDVTLDSERGHVGTSV